MFKKLKEKIAEEVKSSPARFQEIINSAQVIWIFFRFFCVKTLIFFKFN
jgi:hypothetical protein